MVLFEDNTFLPLLKPTPVGRIELHDGYGGKSAIAKMSMTDANKGLGCHITVDGNMKHEFAERIKQCREVASSAQATCLNLRKSHLYSMEES